MWNKRLEFLGIAVVDCFDGLGRKILGVVVNFLATDFTDYTDFCFGIVVVRLGSVRS